MRLPVVPQVSTKDGISNKNARLTNVLAEAGLSGKLGVLRPGLDQRVASTGTGKGLVSFNGALLSVYGAQLQLIDMNPIVSEVYSPTGSNITLNNVLFDGTKHWIFGGFNSTLGYYSEDEGLTWIPFDLPGATLSWERAAYLNGQYIIYIFDNYGNYYTSPDGLNFTPNVLQTTSERLRGITTAGGVFLTVGSLYSHVSSDGLTWVRGTMPLYGPVSYQDSAAWNAVTAGNGRYVAVGRNYDYDAYVAYDMIAYSDDGRTWTKATIPDCSDASDRQSLREVVYTEFGFFAAFQGTTTYLLHSQDGKVWEKVAVGVTIRSPRLGLVNGGVVAAAWDGASSYFLIYSLEGRRWYQMFTRVLVDRLMEGVTPGNILGVTNTYYSGIMQCVQLFDFPERTRDLAPLTGNFFDFTQSTL